MCIVFTSEPRWDSTSAVAAGQLPTRPGRAALEQQHQFKTPRGFSRFGISAGFGGNSLGAQTWASRWPSEGRGRRRAAPTPDQRINPLRFPVSRPLDPLGTETGKGTDLGGGKTPEIRAWEWAGSVLAALPERPSRGCPRPYGGAAILEPGAFWTTPLTAALFAVAWPLDHEHSN
jgi:hypothetical protein